MSVAIAPIVEGQAEVESVPILLRRIIHDQLEAFHVQVARPFRVKRNRIVREGELERAIKLTIKDRGNVGCILVLLDSDDDCPAKLGPSLLERCRQATHLPIAVILANREFEGWFLGAKESLRGFRGIREDVTAPLDPESIRGAKGQLAQNMRGGGRYLTVDDQPTFAARMDLELARRRCPSFDKLFRDVENLISEIPD
ncbi:MAG: DUF4276 family protein [Candidatus Bipolaricaulia bacterium]